MGAIPQWFDESYYINEKANQLLSEYPEQYQDLDTAKEAFLDALDQQGLTTYDHYVLWGDEEGLSPNPLFDREYYINQKAQQLVNAGEATDIDAAKEKFLDALEELGMTVYEHFHKWGWKEGINPSDVFDLDTYFSNKLNQLKELDPDTYGNWTVDDVKDAFDNAGLDPAEHAILYGKDEGVVPSEALDEIEKAQNPGQNFTLTSDTDTITGTSGADTITGVVSALSKEKTLNSTDQIDGGEGKDTIELDVKGSFSGFSGDGKLANVEIVKLTNSGDVSRTFTAKGVSGVEKYIIESDSSTVNLSSLAEIPDEVALKVAKDTTIGFAANVTNGSSDAMTIKVEDMGSSSKAITITANGIENVTLNSAGSSGNYITLTDDAIKELTIQGSSDLTLGGLAGTLTSVDGSSATGNLTIDLTNADTSLGTIKTGSGDDSVKVDLANIKVNAEIDGGDGSDTLIVSKGQGTVQFTMGSVETVQFDAIEGDVTFSAKNTSGVENIVATENVAKNITVANLGNTDLNVELQGKNENAGSISLDHSGSTVVKVDSPSSNATESNPDNNQLDVTFQNSTKLDLQVASNMAYSGDITANNVESITISADGQLGVTGKAATITAGDATSVIISKVAHDSALQINAPEVVTLNATANADLDLRGDDANANLMGGDDVKPDLSGLQELTASIEGDGNVISLPDLAKIHSVTVSGSGSVDLGNLGSNTLADYGIEITASGLAGDDATGGVSLNIGNINTKGTDITIDASEVLGKVNIGAINALNGATTAGNVTIDVNGTGGDVGLGAITGKDVTIDAAGALGKITYGGDIKVGNSLDLAGVDLQSNTLDGIKGGIIKPTGSSFTANISGGIKDDSFKIVTEDANNTTNITVKGDLQIGTDTLIVDASAEITEAVSIDMSGLSDVDTTKVLGGTQDDTITTGDGNDTIYGGKGADTITTGDGKDKVILNSPFNAADSIKDFSTGDDGLYIDLKNDADDNVPASKFGTVNTVDTKFTSGGSLKVIGTITGNVGIVNKNINANSKTAAALNSHLWLKGKSLTIDAEQDQIILKTASGTKTIKSFIRHTTGVTAALFFYDTDDHMLKMYGLKLADNNDADNAFNTVSQLTVKTIAKFTDGKEPVAGDIHIF